MVVSTEETKNDAPARFLLLSGARTASHLLMRILNIAYQPKFASFGTNGYLFMSTREKLTELKAYEKTAQDMSTDDKEQLHELYQSCFDALERNATAAAADGKYFYHKEHSFLLQSPTVLSQYINPQDTVEAQSWKITAPLSYGPIDQLSTNDTVLPDSVLKSFKPTFLIRHPALAFPSAHRTQKDLFKDSRGAVLDSGESRVVTTLLWTRRLYDWYVAQQTESSAGLNEDNDDSWPVILDADDIMTDRAVMIRYSEMLGMDPDLLKFEWDAISESDAPGRMKKIVERMLDTLYASNGIRTDKTSQGIDIAEEGKKWREEFGQRSGELLEAEVRAAMPDYEYLKARRLRGKPSS